MWDVLKLENAKVDPEVIKAYIKNSTVPYNPSPGELITLKEHGVPPEVLAALLQRGGELRAQAGQANPAAAGVSYPGMGPESAAAAPYAYDYSSDYGAYPQDYMYPYDYSYPYWWGYSSWPVSWGGGWWPWWGFGFNNFGHHHFGHNHFNDFDRFHSHGFNHVNQFNRFNHFNHGVPVRFQNDDFNRFSRARFQNFDFNSQAALNARTLSPAPAAFGSFRNAPGAFAPRGSFAPAAFVHGGAFGARSSMPMGVRSGVAMGPRGGVAVSARGGMAMGARGGGGGFHGGGGGGGHR